MNITQVDIKELCDEAYSIDAAMVAHGIEAAKQHNECKAERVSIKEFMKRYAS
jgi:hypothetical protein